MQKAVKKQGPSYNKIPKQPIKNVSSSEQVNKERLYAHVVQQNHVQENVQVEEATSTTMFQRLFSMLEKQEQKIDEQGKALNGILLRLSKLENKSNEVAASKTRKR